MAFPKGGGLFDVENCTLKPLTKPGIFTLPEQRQ